LSVLLKDTDVSRQGIFEPSVDTCRSRQKALVTKDTSNSYKDQSTKKIPQDPKSIANKR